MALTTKRLLFVDEYFKNNQNATQAYLLVYPNASYESARRLASLLLTNDEIRTEVKNRLQKYSLQVENEFIQKSILNLSVKRNRISDKVYFIKAKNGLVKIGITSNIETRFYDLNASSPIELVLLFWIQDKKAKALEQSFHTIFKLKRIRGEWFKLTDEDLSWVKNNYETFS